MLLHIVREYMLPSEAFALSHTCVAARSVMSQDSLAWTPWLKRWKRARVLRRRLHCGAKEAVIRAATQACARCDVRQKLVTKVFGQRACTEPWYRGLYAFHLCSACIETTQYRTMSASDVANLYGLGCAARSCLPHVEGFGRVGSSIKYLYRRYRQMDARLLAQTLYGTQWVQERVRRNSKTATRPRWCPTVINMHTIKRMAADVEFEELQPPWSYIREIAGRRACAPIARGRHLPDHWLVSK